MPLFQVAWCCQDLEWIGYALGELQKAVQNLREGQGYEPNQLVVSKLIFLGIDPNANKLRDRVALKDIRKGLKDDGDTLNSWQIGIILRGLGLEVKTSGGTEYVYLDKAKLLTIAADLGIEDDELKRV